MTKNSKCVLISVSKPDFSIIIPVRTETKYLIENLKILKKIKNIEVIVVNDQASQTPNPAVKRNLGAKIAKSPILVFLDDDSYPDQKYFKNLKEIYTKQKVVAVCGPQLTPNSDNKLQYASGLILSSWLGSGGAGTFRNTKSYPRYVDDYPSVNLSIKKSVFNAIGGFDTPYWPGEDTLFCLKLINQTGNKIYYSPNIPVFHHRRQLGIDFLKQQSRFGIHRGHFAKIYPKNSRKIGYFIPSLFVLYLLSLIFFHQHLHLVPLVTYTILLLVQLLIFIWQKNNLLTSLLATGFIPLTHITYGTFFIYGYFKKQVKFSPHGVDDTGNYTGG